MSASHLAPLSLRIFLGDDYPQMARNQVRNLAERRIRAVTFIAAGERLHVLFTINGTAAWPSA
jgi:hypothetical protein